MKQQTFSDIEYSHRKKKTKREEFLTAMDQIIPWQQWIDLIKTHYPSGKRGRPPKGIETMNSIEASRLESMEFRINVRPSSIKMSKKYNGIRWDEVIENRKSSTRCKVEHPFLIVKRQFGYCKTAYKGLAKNMNRFHVLFACANLVMCIRAGRAEAFCIG